MLFLSINHSNLWCRLREQWAKGFLKITIYTENFRLVLFSLWIQKRKSLSLLLVFLDWQWVFWSRRKMTEMYLPLIDLLKGLNREGRRFCFAWLALGLFYSPSCLQCTAQYVTPNSQSKFSLHLSLPELPIWPCSRLHPSHWIKVIEASSRGN